jgi:Rps23 Pro-64 3,4-dihydroxylase Tpa1-like proline 4-hydroxylase
MESGIIDSLDLKKYVSPKVLADASPLRTRFQSAYPFPHVAIDGFFTGDYSERLHRDFPKRDSSYEKLCKVEPGRIGANYSNQDANSFPDAFKELDRLIKSPDFLDLVSRITGIGGLLYDGEYHGGGIRETSGGTILPTHLDFNHHPRTGSHRRLNLLLYLNKDWDRRWGGNIQAHLDPRVYKEKSVVSSYAPLFNRVFLFETSEISWHGFDKLAPPEGVARRAFSIFYYTKDRPGADQIQLRNSEYAEPPLPERFSAGYTLNETDAAFLKDEVARRDVRIEMLYRIRADFDNKMSHVWREYEYYLELSKKLREQLEAGDGAGK